MHKPFKEVWQELRDALARQPPKNGRSGPPCVRTLVQQVPNEILENENDYIVVCSERNNYPDRVEKGRFEKWWVHLCERGSASLIPGARNNPHPWRSRIVGAIWA